MWGKISGTSALYLELLLSETEKIWVVQVWWDNKEFSFEQEFCAEQVVIEKSIRHSRGDT